MSTFTHLHDPASLEEVTLIHTLFSGSDIVYEVVNEQVGRAEAGVGAPLVGRSAVRLMVATTRLAEAIEVLRPLLADRGIDVEAMLAHVT